MSILRSLALPVLFAATAVAPAAIAQCTYSWPAAAFGSGADEAVLAATTLQNGDLLLGGRFLTVQGTAATRVARWNGTTWQPLGSGANLDVTALLQLANGDIVAGGAFTSIGGVGTNCIARWNGAAWQALGGGIDAVAPFGTSVQAIVALPNGDLIVGGTFSAASGVPVANIARWNGTAWSALGTGCNGAVRGLAVTGSGDVVAAGSFTQAGGVVVNGVARWNGTTWNAFGVGASAGVGTFGAATVAVQANGDIVVGGVFVTAGGAAANRIARWNGAAWSALGTGCNGPVAALLPLPNGELVVGGQFTTAGGLPASRIAKWNGTTWSAFGAGTDGSVFELALQGSGQVLVGGDFSQAGGTPQNRVASLASSCGPSVAAAGAGCTGAAGVPTLVATQLPMPGRTFRARGTNLPPLGLVLAVTGLSPTALPLSLALPQALPGCTLFANPDLIDIATPVAGAAATELNFGTNPALVGIVFYHQYVPLAFDLSFAIVEVTSSNALQVTIGSF